MNLLCLGCGRTMGGTSKPGEPRVYSLCDICRGPLVIQGGGAASGEPGGPYPSGGTDLAAAPICVCGDLEDAHQGARGHCIYCAGCTAYTPRSSS